MGKRVLLACRLKHLRAVVAGGDDGRLNLLRPQCSHQRDRSFIELDAALLKVLQKIFVFEIAQLAHALDAGTGS